MLQVFIAHRTELSLVTYYKLNKWEKFKNKIIKLNYNIRSIHERIFDFLGELTIEEKIKLNFYLENQFSMAQEQYIPGDERYNLDYLIDIIRAYLELSYFNLE